MWGGYLISQYLEYFAPWVPLLYLCSLLHSLRRWLSTGFVRKYSLCLALLQCLHNRLKKKKGKGRRFQTYARESYLIHITIIFNFSTSSSTFAIIEIPARVWHSWKISGPSIKIASTGRMCAWATRSPTHVVDNSIHINTNLEKK